MELLASFGCEPIVLSASIVFRRALLGGNPSPLNEPVKRRIERPLLDLQYLFGIAFNRFGNSVAVRGTEQQSSEDQEVESTLEKFNAVWLMISRHSR